MVTWTRPRQLARFDEYLARAKAEPASISDEQLMEQVRATYWGTNCWCYVEMSLAIISATCALRPHLAEQLIADPIAAMIAGGLDREDEVIAQGVALAHKPDPYVPLSCMRRSRLAAGEVASAGERGESRVSTAVG